MYIDTPIGELRIFIDGESVVEVLLPGWHNEFTPTKPQNVTFAGKVESAFYGYFDAESAKKTKVAYSKLVDVCLGSDPHIDAPGFHQKVYRALIENVPPGSTITYGELAQLAGNPKAARAVGTAMRKNPLPVILPCHRVVPASGGIGGYMGVDDQGQKTKRWLLRHEGVNLKGV